MIAIVGRPGDAAGYDVRLALALRSSAPDIDVRREPHPDAETVLALIGPEWSKHPLDASTVEVIAKALRAGRLIPILVQGATMPSIQTLPSDIQALSTTNAAVLHNERFTDDVAKLLARIRNGNTDAPWQGTEATGQIRIVSTKPALPLRVMNAVDPEAPVNILIDGVTHGSRSLFGDGLTASVTPGRHHVELTTGRSKRLEVEVPPNGRVTLHIRRNSLTGIFRIVKQDND